MKVPAGFSLRETVLSHGWYELAPFQWDDSSSRLLRAERLPDGSKYLFAMAQPGGQGAPVRIHWVSRTPSRDHRKQIRSTVRKILNLDLDLSGFLEICAREPRLRYVLASGAGRFLRCGNPFEEISKTICGTNIAWRQAVLAINRLASLGERVPGTDFRVFPRPTTLLRTGEERLREISRLGYRVPYLLDLARRAVHRDPEWRRLEEEDVEREELSRLLQKVQGVGKASSRYLLMVWGKGEEISVDSSVYLYCRNARFRGRTPTEKQILSLYESFGRWKAYAYWFEFLPWARRHWQLNGKERMDLAKGTMRSGGKSRSVAKATG